MAAGTKCSSYRAELIAIREALSKLTTEDLSSVTEVRICTDSKSALQTLEARPAKQTEAIPIAIWESLLDLQERTHITFQWVPGHAGLQGNDMSDS